MMRIGMQMGLNPIMRGRAAPSLPLDTLTAGAAYSTRLLRTAYTGPLLRVHRSSDNTEQDMAFRSRGIYIGTTGNLSYRDRSGATVTLTNIAAGMWHPIRTERVFSTGTTASGIVAGY